MKMVKNLKIGKNIMMTSVYIQLYIALMRKYLDIVLQASLSFLNK
jgi:hypothetical protein